MPAERFEGRGSPPAAAGALTHSYASNEKVCVLRYGLKTKITVNLAFLLLTAMLLIDLVVITTAQRVLVDAEISRSYLFIDSIDAPFDGGTAPDRDVDASAFGLDFKRRLHEAGYSGGVIVDAAQGRIVSSGIDGVPEDRIAAQAGQTLASGEKLVRFSGTTWGVLWKQRRHLTVSAPMRHAGRAVGAAAVVFPLEKIYHTLRSTQYILLVYMLINAAVLTVVGLYRLSRLTVKPLQRLVKRAGEYREDDAGFFLSEKEDNEFNRLSRALNSMLTHIAADKEKLRLTVKSLEQANRDLKKAQRDVIRAEKLASVGRLSSGIAHEIGNPIGIVTGYLDLLKQDDISDADRKDFILRTEGEINRINTIIRQLLDLSRPSSGGFKTVRVHQIVSDIVDALKFQPEMSRIDLTLDLAAENDTVLADPDQLRQVFLNLLLNAADAISLTQVRRDGAISISSTVDRAPAGSAPEGDGVLSVAFVDNGPGIPEAHLGDIFDPFYTTKAPGKGTGLGLAVCFMIVESFGGRIQASSTKDEGTTMTVHLPLVSRQDKQGLDSNHG